MARLLAEKTDPTESDYLNALSLWVDEPTTDPDEQMREQDIMNLLAAVERRRAQ